MPIKPTPLLYAYFLYFLPSRSPTLGRYERRLPHGVCTLGYSFRTKLATALLFLLTKLLLIETKGHILPTSKSARWRIICISWKYFLSSQLIQLSWLLILSFNFLFRVSSESFAGILSVSLLYTLILHLLELHGKPIITLLGFSTLKMLEYLNKIVKFLVYEMMQIFCMPIKFILLNWNNFTIFYKWL